MKLLDRIEKLLTGYTAAERAEIQRRYIDQRADARLAALVADLEAHFDEDVAAEQAMSNLATWQDLRTGKPVAEQDLPPVVRAFASRVSAAYETAEPKPKTPAQEGEARP